MFIGLKYVDPLQGVMKIRLTVTLTVLGLLAMMTTMPKVFVLDHSK